MEALLGTGVALVTPFDEMGEVDFLALEKLVNFQIENGVNYLVVLGTTGEGATLTVEEKEAVKAEIVRVNAGRLPLVLGMGGNNTASLKHEISKTDFSDYAAILSVCPYYNKPNQEGIYQHFKTVSEVSPLPIIVYNVPGRTGQNMQPETVLRLARDFENIVAVKEAAGDLVQALRLIQHKPKDFLIISGDDMIALPMTLAGGAGVISVIGQGFPKDFSEMIQNGLNGDVAAANELHYKLMDSIDFIFEEGNPAGIKALLEKLNICRKYVRLPLVPASYELQEKLNNFVDRYH